MSCDYGPYLQAVEDELRRLLTAPSAGLGPLYSMMAYHLGWVNAQARPVMADTGKRVRPLLCLLCCQAAGGEWQKAVPVAASLELIHNFSLIHDDIEDNSPTRRGRATVWATWGLAHGINAGDTMLMLARLASGGLRDHAVDPATTLAAMGLLDQACLRLCQGQYLDIAGEGCLDLSEETYLEMIGGKTASLLATSTQLGALIGAGTKTELYRQFGWHLGMAFQMVDDLLGIWGDPAVTGKSAADDIRSRKMTLPVIHTLRGPAGRRLAALYRKSALGDENVAQAVAILDEVRAQAYVQQLAAQHEAAALAALDAAGPCPPAAGYLLELASSLTVRRK